MLLAYKYPINDYVTFILIQTLCLQMPFASVVQPMILTSSDNEEYMLNLCLKLITLLDHEKHPILKEMQLGHFLVHKFWPIGTYHIIVFIQQIWGFFFCQ
jgi:muramoyltetrapeptide carboxypeptidase LdcA involved in peptidoglycan recycling